MKLPVAVTLDKGHEIKLIKRFATLAEAETFLAEDPCIDHVALAAGHYGIDAPESMVNP